MPSSQESSRRVLAGRYRLDDLAGEGGMGSVYRAFDLQAGTVCAVKLLHPALTSNESAATRARVEVATLASIEHDAVVRYRDHGETDAGPFLVMEWVEGQTLRHRLEGEGLGAHEALAIAARLVRAFAVLWSAGVVHRDVTPRNVMLEGGSYQHAKLVDFGIARVDAGPGLTASGVRIGTPRYMAPEQILNSRRVDGRADVFALGCVLFEMLTGRRVFEGDDEVALLARVLLEDAPRASSLRRELPPSLDDLLARMLARDPNQRPFATEDLARELESHADAVSSAGLSAVRVLSRRPALPPTVADDESLPTALLALAPPKLSIAATRAPLVGRSRELAALIGAASRGGVLSIWGPVGAGKTKVLTELGRALADDHEVVMIDLADATEIDTVAQRVAAGLRVPADDRDRIPRALAASRIALLVDSADGALVALASLIGEWIAPSGVIAIASRARFSHATNAIELEPLSPDACLELLRQRMREQGQDADGPAAALRSGVVPKLEGNPLLIELAAARLSLLGADMLAERLAGSIDLFEGARVQGYGSTLAEALEGSWSLLDESGRRALVALGAFAGPFDTQLAEKLVRALGETAALDALQTLRDRSLLARASDGRFTLSEPVRALVARKTSELGLGARVVAAHAEVVLEVAEAAARELARSGVAEARERVAAVERELEAIGERTDQLGPRGGELALRAMLAADAVLVTRVPLSIHLRRLDAALARATADGAAIELVQRARQARGRILALRGSAAEARAELAASLEMARGLNDPERESAAILELGVAEHGLGDLARAESAYRDVLELRTRFDNAAIEARALGNLGAIAHDRHDLREAYRLYVEAIALVENAGDRRLLGVFLGNLAVLDRERGDLSLARRRFVRALETLERVGDVRLAAVALGNLGVLELEREHLDTALDCLTRARAALERFGDVHSEALASCRQAAVLALTGDLESARKALFFARRVARDEVARGLCEVADAYVDAAEGRAEEARAKLARAARSTTDLPSLIDRSDDARALVRVLARTLRAGAR